MLRILGFIVIFASCAATADAQSCATQQGWSNGGWLRCVVRLANGVCSVVRRELPPQGQAVCLGVSAINTLGNLPYRPYQAPPARPQYNYTPPVPPTKMKPYLPNYFPNSVPHH